MSRGSTCIELLSAKLAKLEGVVERPSRFGSHGPAFWFDGRELLHFHGDASVDLRLGRAGIRSRRAELAGDARVKLRTSSSADWVEVALRARQDVAFVLELARGAVAAGDQPRPGPSSRVHAKTPSPQRSSPASRARAAASSGESGGRPASRRRS